jgi:lipoate-protein ligase B
MILAVLIAICVCVRVSAFAPAGCKTQNLQSHGRIVRGTRAYSWSSQSLPAVFKQQLGEFDVLFEEVASDAANANELEEIRRQRRIRLMDYISLDKNEEGRIDNHQEGRKIVDYDDGWNMQKRLVDAQLHRLTEARKNNIPEYDNCYDCMEMSSDLGEWSQWEPAAHLLGTKQRNTFGTDCVIMLEHSPVYTLGTGSDEKFIKQNSAVDSSSIQIVRIERGGEVTYHGPGQLVVYPILDLRGYKKDIHWYMRALEEAIILALQYAGINHVRCPLG